MTNQLIYTGNAAREPVFTVTSRGTAIADFTLAYTPRRLNKHTNQWEDADCTIWLKCTAYGDLAEQLAHDIKKGTKVTIYGSLRCEEWTSKTNTTRREICATVDAARIHEKPTRTNTQNNKQPTNWDTPPTDLNPAAPF